MSDLEGQAVVLGAGVSGLGAARALQEAGLEPQVVEACPTPGGLTRTITVGEFCFDYTGHLLHLARYSTPSRLPYAGLRDDDWQRVERRSYCYVGDRLITAPLQYHLGQLPAELLDRCMQAYEQRPPLVAGREPTFRDYLVSGFGTALADLFLIPQNEKTMATPLERLALGAVKRFFPPPDEARIRAGLRTGESGPAEYNSQFWYPRVGGIQRFVDGLAAGLQRPIALGEEVREIDLPSRRLRSRNGSEWRWDVLFTSMPLRQLCHRSGDAQLRAWSAALSHSATVTYNIGIRGDLPPELEGVHWIYVPDRAIPFYRVGFYSNMSKGMCPRNCASAYVEVGVPGDQVATVNVAGALQAEVLAALDRLGWIPTSSITCCVAHVVSCAYVHHTPAREDALAGILGRLEEFSVYPVGRYGLWDYTSMEDCLASAVDTVRRVTGCAIAS